MPDSKCRGARARSGRHSAVRLTALAALGFAWGCGARSTLTSFDEQGGAGGTFPSTAGTAAGGGATSGGAAVAGGGAAVAGNGGRNAGGAGGQGAAAGSGGSGGAVYCGRLIDDMEDGSGRICRGSGRVGAWYAYNDGFGLQVPPPQPPGVPILPFEIPGTRQGSQRAMFSSHHYPDPSILKAPDTWGAGIGVDLAFDGARYLSYDASGFTGIYFWNRSSNYKYFEVRINTTATTPVAYGGTCPSEYCGAYVKGFWSDMKWQESLLYFSDLQPRRYLDVVLPPFDARQVTNIQFFFVLYPTGSSDADLWVDDLSFVAGLPPPR